MPRALNSRRPLVLSLCMAGLALALALGGCVPEKNPLDDVQAAASSLKQCMISRTYRDECNGLNQGLEIARLTVIKAGKQTAQIEAALALGKLQVQGREEDSPYADFIKRRREVLAANLVKVSPEKFAEDQKLAQAIESLKRTGQPMTPRQQAESMLVQAMLEEQYPAYFAEPENGMETDPEILALTCQPGSRALLAQACVRFKGGK